MQRPNILVPGPAGAFAATLLDLALQLTVRPLLAVYDSDRLPAFLRVALGPAAQFALGLVGPTRDDFYGEDALHHTWALRRVASGVENYINAPLNYTVTFAADGAFTGREACNVFHGRFRVDEGRVVATGVVSTRAYCTREADLVEFLRQRPRLEVAGNTLVLTTSGRTLHFERVYRGVVGRSESQGGFDYVTVRDVDWYLEGADLGGRQGEAVVLLALAPAVSDGSEGATALTGVSTGQAAYVSFDDPGRDTRVETQWALVRTERRGVTNVIDTPLDYTLTLRPGGRVEGRENCNTFSGTFSTAPLAAVARRLEVRDVVATEAACAVEADLQGLLGGGPRYTVTQDPPGSASLALRTCAGDRYIFSEVLVGTPAQSELEARPYYLAPPTADALNVEPRQRLAEPLFFDDVGALEPNLGRLYFLVNVRTIDYVGVPREYPTARADAYDVRPQAVAT